MEKAKIKSFTNLNAEIAEQTVKVSKLVNGLIKSSQDHINT